ncbi:MAG: transcription termination/antitermination protein NusG [Caldisericum sp.]
MYLIILPRKLAKVVTKYYERSNFLIRQVEIGDNIYLISYINPAEVLPYDLLGKIKVERINIDQMKKILKSQEKSKKQKILGEIGPGQKVVIINGPYKDMKGIINRVLPEGKCEVIVSVFGTPVPITVQQADLLTEESLKEQF